MGRRRKSAFHLPNKVYFNRSFYWYVDPNGHWHKLGKLWNREARNEYDRLSLGRAPGGTAAELLDAYLVHAENLVRERKRSRRTLDDNYAEARFLKLVFGRTAYTEITEKHVATYLRKRKDEHGKPAPIRANREAALLSSAYAWAMGEDAFEVTRNPCYGVRRNTETPRDRYVETMELQRFTRVYAPDWMRCYVLLKRLIGIRQGDMLRITRGALGDRGLEVEVGKTGKKLRFRWTWALRMVVAALLKLQGDDEKIKPIQLFVTAPGRPLTRLGFKSAWQRAMNAYVAAGNDRFWEHDIRAKSASDANSTRRAQELLDHESAATTQRHYRRGTAKVSPFR